MVKAYCLSSEEIDFCREYAQAIDDNNAPVANSKKVTQKQGQIKIRFEGACAELAFAKLFAGEHLTENYLRVASEDPGDVVLPSGESVDVKVTRYATGRLVVPLWKAQSPVDRYALMVGECPIYEYVGSIEAKDVYRDENVRDLGYGPCFVVEREALNGD